MDNNKVTSNAIASLYNTNVNYILGDNQISFKHIELLPAGQLSESIQVFPTSGTVSKVAWNEPIATMKPIHQSDMVRGYKGTTLKLSESGQWKTFGTHRLVHFADNGEWSDKAEKTTIHHINSITSDNRASNLKLISSSENVLRFFRGADNQDYIKSQEYQTDRINQGTVPLVHKGKLIEGYTINTMGDVYHKRYIKGRNEWKVTKVNPRHASKKYRMTLVVGVADKSASLHNLMAENFLVTPEGTRFKTLMIDASIANPYQPQNLYTVPVKQFN
ncbi:HNH endonuclease [Weissella hellenica]|nr:HNH endonuclease [Weissella hellenica]